MSSEGAWLPKVLVTSAATKPPSPPTTVMPILVVNGEEGVAGGLDALGSAGVLAVSEVSGGGICQTATMVRTPSRSTTESVLSRAQSHRIAGVQRRCPFGLDRSGGRLGAKWPVCALY